MRAYILYLLAVTVVFALITEGALYFLYTNPPKFFRLAAQSYYLKYERDIVQFNPECAQYDEKLGYRFRAPGCIFKNREFSTRIDVNQKGVRDDDESLIKPEIAVIGDSTGFGWGVENSKIFSSLLEANLGLKVLNLSVPSYGTARELKILSEVDTSNLKYLIIQFCANDQDENIAFVNQGGKLDAMTREKYQDAVSKNPSRNKYYPGKFLRFMPKLFLDAVVKQPPTNSVQPAIDKSGVFLKALKLSPVALDKLEKIIVIEANPYHLQDPHFAKVLREEISKDTNFALRRKIHVIDVVQPMTIDDYFALEDHWNEAGHKKVFELIKKELLGELQVL